MPGKIRELSWSLSKARMFQECPRRYYYHNYFSKAGYSPDAPEEARLALEMRSVKSLDMWAGEVVHAAIQWALEQVQAGHAPSVQDAKAETRRLLSEGWRASVSRLWRTYPKDDHPNIFEHYYGLQVRTETTDRIKNKAFLSAGNFMESEIFKSIAATPADRWLPVERYAAFRLDGLLFYLKFDFALRNGKQLTVYDWKTGKPSSEEIRQLSCYAMYASDKWQIPLENVKVCAVHLQPTVDVNEHLVGLEEMEDVRRFVKDSFHAMLECLRDPARNLAAMDDFPMTGNLLRCPRCNFKGICPQGEAAFVEDIPMPNDWE